MRREDWPQDLPKKPMQPRLSFAERYAEADRAGSRGELGYFLARGHDPIAGAQGLWNVSPDLSRMDDVREAHGRQAIRTLSSDHRRNRRA